MLVSWFLKTILIVCCIPDANILYHTLDKMLLREEHILNTVRHVRAPPEGKLDPECSRRVSPSAEFDVLVTVLNPEPEKMTVDFNLPQAIHGYLGPIFHDFQDLNTIHAKSQWLYLVGLKINPKKLGEHFALAESSLPHVITPLEKKLCKMGLGFFYSKLFFFNSSIARFKTPDSEFRPMDPTV